MKPNATERLTIKELMEHPFVCDAPSSFATTTIKLAVEEETQAESKVNEEFEPQMKSNSQLQVETHWRRIPLQRQSNEIEAKENEKVEIAMESELEVERMQKRERRSNNVKPMKMVKNEKNLIKTYKRKELRNESKPNNVSKKTNIDIHNNVNVNSNLCKNNYDANYSNYGTYERVPSLFVLYNCYD